MILYGADLVHTNIGQSIFKRNVAKGDDDFKTLQRMNRLGPFHLPLVPGPVPTKYTVLPDIKKNALEFSNQTNQEVDTNSSSLFQEEILVPPKYNILLDLKKKMEERNQQMDQAKTKCSTSLGASFCHCLPEKGFQGRVSHQTPTDLNTVAEVQVPGDQVTEKLSNPKLLHTTLSILPEIRKMVVERKCQIDQQESSKVSISLRTVEAEAKSVPKNLNQERVRKGLPLSPAVALQYFQKHLTSLEQREILDFPEIWYLGLGAEKKDPQEMAEYSEDSNSNSDHDDESGIYVPVLHDHIAYRYEILENLGQGSFGLVLKCLDHKIKELVALKVIHDMESANNRALKELEILDAVRREDKENQYNVIHMKEHMTFRKHLCITFELQGMDLYELMKENSFKGFSMSQTRHYATALVNSLQMLHRKKIVHCDLKPENILLSERRHGNIKLADFGCSFYEHQEGCTYVQTRFYRAPEVILGIPFGTAIDMWSLGCILAELYTGYPLFSGTNEVDQLACIMEVLGTPPDYIVRMSPRRKVFFDSKGQTACLAKRPNSKDLASALRSRDLLFVDFVTRCLTWDSAQRMTAEEAAWHQWLQKPRVTSWWPVTLACLDPTLPSSPGSVRDQTWTLSTRNSISARPLLSRAPVEGEEPQSHGSSLLQNSQLQLYTQSFSPLQCCKIM